MAVVVVVLAIVLAAAAIVGVFLTFRAGMDAQIYA
jgi:hypothetical protein